MSTIMDVETAARFISSLTKSLQTVLHGCLDFEKDIELGGYIYLRVDSSEKLDYVLSEKMQKNDVNSLTFLSNSFRAIPQGSSDHNKSCRESNIPHAKDQTGSYGQTTDSGSDRTAEETRLSSSSNRITSSSASLPQSKQQHFNSNNTVHKDARGHPDADFSPTGARVPQGISNSRRSDPAGSKESRHLSGSDPGISVTSFLGVHRSSTDTKQSLTDFQTAFHSSRTTFPTSSHLQQPLLQNTPFSQADVSDRGPVTSQQQHQQKGKEGLLPDANDMEVVYIKTEEEDDVFSIPLNPPAEEAADDLTVRRKPPWLPMGMRQPFYFPYPRLARSQSWDRRFAQAGSNPRSPVGVDESSAAGENYSCKVCGKCYRSRQGLIFHERVKHQNIFNVYCPVCGKGFQQTSHMYGHMATHTNVKNFQCQGCGAKYAHKTSLQQHLRTGSCRPHAGMSYGQGPQSQMLNRSPASSMIADHTHQTQTQHQNQNVDLRSESGQEENLAVHSRVQETRECLNESANFSKGQNRAAEETFGGEECQRTSAEDGSFSELNSNISSGNGT